MLNTHREINLTGLPLVKTGFVLPKLKSVTKNGKAYKNNVHIMTPESILAPEFISFLENDCDLEVRVVDVFYFNSEVHSTLIHRDGPQDKEVYAVNFSVTASPVKVTWYQPTAEAAAERVQTNTLKGGGVFTPYFEQEVEEIDSTSTLNPFLFNASVIHRGEIENHATEQWIVSVRVAAKSVDTWDQLVENCRNYLI